MSFSPIKIHLRLWIHFLNLFSFRITNNLSAISNPKQRTSVEYSDRVKLHVTPHIIFITCLLTIKNELNYSNKKNAENVVSLLKMFSCKTTYSAVSLTTTTTTGIFLRISVFKFRIRKRKTSNENKTVYYVTRVTVAFNRRNSNRNVFFSS